MDAHRLGLSRRSYFKLIGNLCLSLFLPTAYFWILNSLEGKIREGKPLNQWEWDKIASKSSLLAQLSKIVQHEVTESEWASKRGNIKLSSEIEEELDNPERSGMRHFSSSPSSSSSVSLGPSLTSSDKNDAAGARSITKSNTRAMAKEDRCVAQAPSPSPSPSRISGTALLSRILFPFMYWLLQQEALHLQPRWHRMLLHQSRGRREQVRRGETARQSMILPSPKSWHLQRRHAATVPWETAHQIEPSALKTPPSPNMAWSPPSPSPQSLRDIINEQESSKRSRRGQLTHAKCGMRRDTSSAPALDTDNFRRKNSNAPSPSQIDTDFPSLSATTHARAAPPRGSSNRRLQTSRARSPSSVCGVLPSSPKQQAERLDFSQILAEEQRERDRQHRMLHTPLQEIMSLQYIQEAFPEEYRAAVEQPL